MVLHLMSLWKGLLIVKKKKKKKKRYMMVLLYVREFTFKAQTQEPKVEQAIISL